jgi:steroid 5-alpha reductase family enzyme
MESSSGYQYDYNKLMLALATPFVMNVFVYIIAQIKKDNGIVDIAWATMFVASNFVLLYTTNNWNPRTYLIFGLVTLWWIRLSGHIAIRHTGTEDYRY